MTPQEIFLHRAYKLWRRRWLPGSLWGVAQSLPQPTIITFTPNVTLAAGVETTIAATAAALVGTPGMNYYPLIFGVCACTNGGTAPTALTFAARFAGGADFATQIISALTLTISVTVNYPVLLIGANARANAAGLINAAAIQITGLAATTANTAVAIGSQFLVALLPGPDL
ncbi:MAG TPA: hypothetical protein VGI65_00730 [Steroidobacteraceae bacterium]|jgi:hypothetical protein